MTPWPLSVAFPLTLLGSIVLVVGFAALGAWFAREHPPFKYRNLWPVQLGLYVVIGFIAMFTLLDLRLVEAVGAITGLVEATLGWKITWSMGPGRIPDTTPMSIGVAILSMTAFGFGLAIAGALIFNAVAGALLRAHGG
ncbi:MAG: hypothetical protein QOJ39_759 [Candidatus Eremiobacteraeota bacterium]|nr:hypothetical protein [Candidatus Eremiobacteraeota bacterium]